MHRVWPGDTPGVRQRIRENAIDNYLITELIDGPKTLEEIYGDGQGLPLVIGRQIDREDVLDRIKEMVCCGLVTILGDGRYHHRLYGEISPQSTSP